MGSLGKCYESGRSTEILTSKDTCVGLYKNAAEIFKSSVSGVLPYAQKSICLWTEKVLLGSVPNLAEEICIFCPGPALRMTAECVVGDGQSSPQPGVRMGTKGS